MLSTLISQDTLITSEWVKSSFPHRKQLQPEGLKFHSRGDRPRIKSNNDVIDPEGVEPKPLIQIRPLQGRAMLIDMVRWRGHRLLNRTLSACKKTFARVSGRLKVPQAFKPA